MIAVEILSQTLSLNKSLHYCGLSKTAWYHSARPRDVAINRAVSGAVQEIGHQRPTYETRRMAAAASRQLQTAVNRKQVQRIFRKLGWIAPRKTKKEIMPSSSRLFKPSAPNQLWRTDMTYVWCGIDRWCFCINVIDVFTR